MEIIIGAIVLIGIVLFLGGLNNNRPVKEWSDDKLMRMHGKLLHTSSMASKANRSDKASELSQKAEEVKNEIIRRQQNIENQYATALDDTFKDLEKMIIKRKEIIESQKDVIATQGITEEEYDNELSKKIIQMITVLEKKYIESHNISQLEAYEKATNEVLNYPTEKFI